MLWIFLFQIIADNIEIEINEFDEVIVNDQVIKSSELTGFTNLKISHPGTSIYKLEEIEKRKFKLIDITRYFDKKYERKVQIDFENKEHGVLLGQGVMIVLTCGIAFCFLFIFENIFGVFKI